MKRTRYQHVLVYIKDGETQLLNYAIEKAKSDPLAQMEPKRVVFHPDTTDSDKASALKCLGLSDDQSMIDDWAFPDESISNGDYAKIAFQGPERTQ